MGVREHAARRTKARTPLFPPGPPQMAPRLKPLDSSQIHTGSVRGRTYWLTVEQLAAPPRAGASLQTFLSALPRTGQATELHRAARLIAQTALDEKPIVWLLDVEFVNVGLTPILIHMLRRPLVYSLVLDGRAALADLELAFHGVTHEDRVSGLEDGLLGLARETGEVLNEIINGGARRGFSLGETMGRGILDRQPQFMGDSLLAAAAQSVTPVTIHATLGADGFHRYPGVDGAMLGKAGIKDASILASLLSELPTGSLIVATHRNPVLTEVVIHAYALARNQAPELGALNLLRLGEADQTLTDLPDLQQEVRLRGPLELTVPLLVGEIFSLVE